MRHPVLRHHRKQPTQYLAQYFLLASHYKDSSFALDNWGSVPDFFFIAMINVQYIKAILPPSVAHLEYLFYHHHYQVIPTLQHQWKQKQKITASSVTGQHKSTWTAKLSLGWQIHKCLQTKILDKYLFLYTLCIESFKYLRTVLLKTTDLWNFDQIFWETFQLQ